MKKYTFLFLFGFMFLACNDNVEFNTPAFQADLENELWRADAFSAEIDANGLLVISGTNNFETVHLKVHFVSESTYFFGTSDAIEAQYTNDLGNIFTTNNRPDESTSIYPELGKMTIETIDFVNSTFTGTFWFLAFDDEGLNSVLFTNGIIFKVPLISGIIPAFYTTCEDSTTALDVALAAYEAFVSADVIFVNSAEYQSVCELYLESLQLKRNYCGDSDGSLQNAIDVLENCQLPCIIAAANSAAATSQFNAATLGSYIALCSQYKFYLEEQLLFCGDPNGNLLQIIDTLNCEDSDEDGVPDIYEDFNGDGNLDNDDIDADSTPNYLDTDDDGDGILTINEAKDSSGNPKDTDGDGGADYLDKDDDGDGLLSNFETNDTDGDGIMDYLENDDDDDGILTINENADPNADGNPVDALDSDGNGIPDYLQAQ